VKAFGNSLESITGENGRDNGAMEKRTFSILVGFFVWLSLQSNQNGYSNESLQSSN
jgi:hypothetical protein